MARLAPTLKTWKALLARSGNQCAFPGCDQALINDKNQFIGQLCHIEAAMPKGPRYNEGQTDEERRAYENLLLLCYPHHIETNDGDEYPVEKLQDIKQRHEATHESSRFQIKEAELLKLVEETEKFWARIERLNRVEHSMQELAFEINPKETFFDVLSSIKHGIDSIKGLLDSLRRGDEELPKEFRSMLIRKNIAPGLFSDVPYYENPFENRNWETHNIYSRNCLTSVGIDLVHLEVKYLEEYVLSHPKEAAATERLERARANLAELAQHAAHID